MPRINGAACNPQSCLHPDLQGCPDPGPPATASTWTHSAACISDPWPCLHSAPCSCLYPTQPGWMGLPAPWGCLPPRLGGLPAGIPDSRPCRVVPSAVPSGRRGRGCQPLLMRCGLTAGSGGRQLCSRLPGAGVSAPASPVAAGKGRAGPGGDAPAPPPSITHRALGCGNCSGGELGLVMMRKGQTCPKSSAPGWQMRCQDGGFITDFLLG